MEDTQTLRLHPSLRNFLSLFILPILGAPTLIVLIKYVLWSAMPFWPWMLLIIVGLGVLPGVAWIRTRFHTYEVRPESVLCQKGLISRDSSEIRIVDIRLVNVRQGVLQRILNIGNVGFASAAGGQEEVIFADVGDPFGVKKLVQDRMKTLRPEGDE